MDNIEEFVKIERGTPYRGCYGYGDGSGDGDGGGCGGGDGDGSGYVHHYDDGAGAGKGDGSGYGHHYDDSSGYVGGSGKGYGNGAGYGNGYGIKSINGHRIHMLDNISTILTKSRGNYAKAFIVQIDLSFTPCYVAKSGNLFAHGKTLHEAQEQVAYKAFMVMDIDDRISAFLAEFNLSASYPAMKFFDWHNKLTGSCLLGRETFAREHNIDLHTDTLTVGEFIELTQHSYQGEIIQELKNRIEKSR